MKEQCILRLYSFSLPLTVLKIIYEREKFAVSSNGGFGKLYEIRYKNCNVLGLNYSTYT